MDKLSDELSNVSQTLGAVLDKALAEPEFRWKLISDIDLVMTMYGIREAGDVAVLKKIAHSFRMFLIHRLNMDVSTDFTFSRTNEAITYSEAIEYRRSHR